MPQKQSITNKFPTIYKDNNGSIRKPGGYVQKFMQSVYTALKNGNISNTS